MRDVMKIQKTAVEPSSGVTPTRPESDIVPLNAYAIAELYQRYPRSVNYAYEQQNLGPPTTRHAQYPNRRSYNVPAVSYDRDSGYCGSYAPNLDGRFQGPEQITPLAHGTQYEPARPLAESIHPSRGSALAQSRPLINEEHPALQPIVSPNGTLYYPAHPRVCFHCQEEGHFRPQCPRLHGRALRTVTLRPEHSGTNVRPWAAPPAQSHSQPVSVVEVAARSSALDGMKVCQVTPAYTDSVDLNQFIHKVTTQMKTKMRSLPAMIVKGPMHQ